MIEKSKLKFQTNPPKKINQIIIILIKKESKVNHPKKNQFQKEKNLNI